MASSGTAGAISNATPDTGNHYPYVGTLVLQIGQPGSYTYHYWCSGTLVAAGGARSTTAVALVANGHCFDSTVQESMFPGSTLLGVTVEPVVSTTTEPPGNSVHPGIGYINLGYPRFYDDVGVYILNQPFNVGVPLPRLPHAGELAEIRDDAHRQRRHQRHRLDWRRSPAIRHRDDHGAVGLLPAPAEHLCTGPERALPRRLRRTAPVAERHAARCHQRPDPGHVPGA